MITITSTKTLFRNGDIITMPVKIFWEIWKERIKTFKWNIEIYKEKEFTVYVNSDTEYKINE